MPNIADCYRPGFSLEEEARRRGETVWQGDNLDRKKESISYDEARGALLALGYTYFYGRPLLPHQFIGAASNDLLHYSLARTLKDHDDAIEGLELEDERVHIALMRDELLWLAEDLHEHGVNIEKLVEYVQKDIAQLAHTALLINSRDNDKKSPSETFSKKVWNKVLQQSEQTLKYQD